jgi:hypothetical protein
VAVLRALAGDAAARGGAGDREGSGR